MEGEDLRRLRLKVEDEDFGRLRLKEDEIFGRLRLKVEGEFRKGEPVQIEDEDFGHLRLEIEDEDSEYIRF